MQWSFLTFFFIFEVGSAICGAAQSSTMLIVGRAIAGIGASGLLNGAYTILVVAVAPAQQVGKIDLSSLLGCKGALADFWAPVLRGVLTGLAFIGILAGPLVGGALTSSNASWRWCEYSLTQHGPQRCEHLGLTESLTGFYINLPCGAIIAMLIIFTPFPNYRVAGDGSQTLLERLSRLDIVGFLLFAPTAVMLILALQWGGIRYAWSSATIIGLFCGSFGNLLVFLAWEHRVGSGALVPLGMLRRRVIWTSCLNMAFFIGCIITTSYYFPVWFQTVHGESPVASGVDMLPIIGTNTVVTMITGGLIARVGYYTPFALASGVFTSVGAGLVTTLTPHSSRSRRVGYQLLMGMQGLGFQVPLLAVQNGVRRDEVSVASAVVVLAQYLSSSIFLSLSEVIFSTELRRFLVQYAPEADIGAIIAAGAGAADLKAVVSPDMLPQVQRAYSDTFNRVMYLATGSASAAFIVAACMGWGRIRGAPPVVNPKK